MSQIAMESKPVASGAPVPLNVSFELEPGHLRVKYSVKNTREHPIYLFNVIWEFGPKGQYVPARTPVYVSLRRDLLHLSKAVLPAPKDHAVELRIVPFVTKVDAGETFEEEVRLSLPIDEFNPYFPATQDSKYKTEWAERIVFSLQFVNETPDMKTPPAPLPNGIHLQHPRLLALVETVQSQPQVIRVPVNKRLDKFEEF